jgi:hypothetical protein
MRLFLSINVIILVSLTSSRAWAYAVLDRVKMSALPTIWRKTSDDRIQYHIKYRTGNSAYIYLKTDSTEPIDLNYQIVGFQTTPQKTRVEPGTINVVETPVSLADHRLAYALLQTLFENGPAKAPPASPNVADDSGYFVSLANEDVDFNPVSIGYFIKQRNENIAEVHFRNYTDKRSHFNFRIVGYRS